MVTVGIDVGGTFTDFVACAPEKLSILKAPSTNPPSLAVVRGIKKLGEIDIVRIVHGTTVATNAVLQGKWAKTALLTTQGFRDVLEIGRQNRPSLYDLFCVRPEPLVPRERRLEVPERLDAQGKIIRPLDESAVRRLAKELKGNVESIAVSFLFSFLNPSHERRAREILEEEGIQVPVTLSCEVLPEFREYERTSTTVLTAALRPLVATYVADLARELGVRLLLMQSNGGIAGPEEIERNAAALLLSGPAGGAIGARFVGLAVGFPNLITLDMGGTSTDVSLIRDGTITYRAEKEVAGRPVRLVTVDVYSVGAGGGSLAHVEESGMLQVGPQSAGAEPGPACYGRGGTAPTVTDAHLCLGHFPADKPLGGLPPLSLPAAQHALLQLGKKLGLRLEETALGILEVAEATVERAIRVISVERGYDPREYVLLAFGGAGPLHAVSLAQKLGMNKVLIPAWAGVLSALGLAVADIIHTYVRSLIVSLSEAPIAAINAVFADLKNKAERGFAEEGIPEEVREYWFSADLRYRGQGFELTVPVPSFPLAEEDILKISEEFHRAHEQRYGFSRRDEEVELVSLRLTAVGHTEKPDLPKVPAAKCSALAPCGQRPVLFPETGWVKTPVYARASLGAGAELSGPAVVEGPESTILLPPATKAFVDAFGNLVAEV